MEDAEHRFAFRPLAASDLATLHAWLNAPHARRWFDGGKTHAEVSADYVPVIEGRADIAGFVATLDGRDVGMFEWVRVGDHPEFQRTYRIEDPDAANCDVLLGEPDVVHRGLGPAAVRAFLRQVVFADPRVTECVIDPLTDNAIAIRAYEKAGFRFTRALPDDGEGCSVYLMTLRRDALDAPVVEGGVVVRPGRPEELSLAHAIDDDACTLYAEAGFSLDDDPRSAPVFARESVRWAAALASQRLLFACTPAGERAGFAALGLVDGQPILEQLSVRRAWMRRGVGRALLERAKRWSVRAGALWLTTYDHVPWNLPMYERHGFVRADARACGPELAALLELERRCLPAGEHHVAMRYAHPR